MIGLSPDHTSQAGILLFRKMPISEGHLFQWKQEKDVVLAYKNLILRGSGLSPL